MPSDLYSQLRISGEATRSGMLSNANSVVASAVILGKDHTPSVRPGPIDPVVSQLPKGNQSASPKELFQSISAESSDNGITIYGKVRGLPSGTKIRVEIIQLPDHSRIRGEGPMNSNVLVDEGAFKAKIINSDQVPFPAGSYSIRITSYFNSSWQSGDVLNKAGVTDLDSLGRSAVNTDPRAIPDSSDFKPDDPEFPKASRHLEAVREVRLASPTADEAAIAAVRGATLFVAGSGRSSLSIGRSIDFFASMPGFKPLTWSAVAKSNTKWVVTLHCVDGEVEKSAQWEFNLESKAVKYLDPLAKLLSYVPAK